MSTVKYHGSHAFHKQLTVLPMRFTEVRTLWYISFPVSMLRKKILIRYIDVKRNIKPQCWLNDIINMAIVHIRLEFLSTHPCRSRALFEYLRIFLSILLYRIDGIQLCENLYCLGIGMLTLIMSLLLTTQYIGAVNSESQIK